MGLGPVNHPRRRETTAKRRCQRRANDRRMKSGPPDKADLYSLSITGLRQLNDRGNGVMPQDARGHREDSKRGIFTSSKAHINNRYLSLVSREALSFKNSGLYL